MYTPPIALETVSGGPADSDYWHGLIDEREAGAFLNLQPRTMQSFRYQGGGPKFIRVSSRCIRYRRADLREWSEARLCTSTADEGGHNG